MNRLFSITGYLLRIKWRRIKGQLVRPFTSVKYLLLLGVIVSYAYGQAYLYDLSPAENGVFFRASLQLAFLNTALLLPLFLHLLPSVTAKYLVIQKHHPVRRSISFGIDILFNLFSRKYLLCFFLFLLLYLFSSEMKIAEYLKYLFVLLAGFFMDQAIRLEMSRNGFTPRLLILFMVLLAGLWYLNVYHYSSSILPTDLLFLSVTAFAYFLCYVGKINEQQVSSQGNAKRSVYHLDFLLVKAFFKRKKVITAMAVFLLFKTLVLVVLVYLSAKGKILPRFQAIVYALFETPLPAFCYIMNNSWGYQPQLMRKLFTVQQARSFYIRLYILLLLPFISIDLVFFAVLSFSYSFPLLNAALFFINAYVLAAINGYLFSVQHPKILEQNDTAWAMKQQTAFASNVVTALLITGLFWQMNDRYIMGSVLVVTIVLLGVFLGRKDQPLHAAFMARFHN